MRATHLLTFGTLSVGLAAFGCSAPVAAEGSADAEVTTRAMAIVVVERTNGPGDSTRAEAVARFVQMRAGAVDDQALRMVGAVVDFPALGECAPMRANQTGYDSPARAVKLADVGSVTVEANGVRTSFVPRRVPDVADLVSGVVYTARGEQALAPHTLYTVRGTGTTDVDSFEALATAPSEPNEVRVAGQDGTTTVALGAGSGVDVSWDVGLADDLVYVDVTPNDTTTPAVRCLFSDNGRARLDASALGAMDEGTMSIHRLHRETFRAKGLDTGEIRFDFARALPFTRR